MEGHDDAERALAGGTPAPSRSSRGVTSDEIELGYQVVVDVLTSSVVALEAQVAWRRPDGDRLHGPGLDVFAEAYGLVDQLGEVSVRRAVADMARGRVRGWDLPVTLPVSAPQVTAPGFSGWLLDLLASAEVPARRLTIELSESAVATHPSLTRAALWQLRGAGIGVQLSELGADSDLLLRVVPVTAVKVDRFLVARLGQSPEAERTVAGILATAATMGLDTVVAGVETTDQLRVLRRLGCPRATGSLWSLPQPFDLALRAAGVPRPRTVT